MAQFHIYFYGLICHIGELTTEKLFAAIVKEEGHRRYIQAGPGADLDIPAQTSRLAFRFDDEIEKGRAATDDPFADFVPSLHDLMGGTLVNDAVMATNAVLVDYPPSQNSDGSPKRSQLSVAQLYKKKAVHVGGGKILRPQNCVARFTKLTVTRSTAGPMRVYALPQEGDPLATIEDNGCLLIANESRALAATSEKIDHEHEHEKRKESAEHVHGRRGSHAQHYAQIVIEDNPIVEVGEVNNDGGCESPNHLDCDWLHSVGRGIVTFTSVYAECGNTSWP